MYQPLTFIQWVKSTIYQKTTLSPYKQGLPVIVYSKKEERKDLLLLSLTIHQVNDAALARMIQSMLLTVLLLSHNSQGHQVISYSFDHVTVEKERTEREQKLLWHSAPPSFPPLLVPLIASCHQTLISSHCPQGVLTSLLDVQTKSNPLIYSLSFPFRPLSRSFKAKSGKDDDAEAFTIFNS